MADEPKVKKQHKVVKVLTSIWNFLDGHKTKIGTAIYFANKLFGDKLPSNWSAILETGSEAVIALGWAHYAYKGGKQNSITKQIFNKSKTK